MFEKVVYFIRDTFKEKEAFIPLHEPLFIGNEKEYLDDVIKSTFVSSVGAFVDRLEQLVSTIVQTERCLSIVNGTSALHLALKLCGVERNTEVVTQALTFVATPNAISYCDAFPVFLDVDKKTMGLSPQALLSFLEEFGDVREEGTFNKKSGRRISACVPMHTFGFPCDITTISSICKSYNIPLVEDSAEALGTYFENKHETVLLS